MRKNIEKASLQTILKVYNSTVFFCCVCFYIMENSGKMEIEKM